MTKRDLYFGFQKLKTEFKVQIGSAFIEVLILVVLFFFAYLLQFFGMCMPRNADNSKTEDAELKTSFNYCSSGSGQNSVIPVVCDVPE